LVRIVGVAPALCCVPVVTGREETVKNSPLFSRYPGI
jgi:hypothetical protein